jgi:arylsulfatase A-like enzyme
LLEGTTDKLRDDIFLAYSNQQRALVKDDYKYIIYNVEGKITEQLFNLKKDPKEMANLADAMPQKAAAYKEMLIQRLKEQQDFCNIDTPLWWKDGHKITWDELINLYIFE